MSTSPSNAARFMREFACIDVSALLPRVRCPTLVLHSRREVRQRFEQGRLLPTQISGAQPVPIDSGNHLLLRDEPEWTQWIEAVHAFLPGASGAYPPGFATLNERQRELVELIAQGRDNA